MVPELRSYLWSRDRTYSVVVRDGAGTVHQHSKGLGARWASRYLQEQRIRYQTLSVKLHLDMHMMCTNCSGTGLREWATKHHELCPECDGRGMIISEDIGPEVPQGVKVE